MSPVTPAEALACLADVARQYRERYGTRAPLHALLADILFPLATDDYTRAAQGEPYRPTPKRLRDILTALEAGSRSFSPSSFRGNRRIQLDLAGALLHLKAYETPDGRHLYVVGPEHKHRGTVELYFTVVEGAPQRTTDAIPPPVDEHEARVQRLTVLIAHWVAGRLLRRSPEDIKRLERYAKKRGVGYALAAFFGFVACTGVVAAYRLSLHDITVLGVQCAIDQPPNGGAAQGSYVVMWERGSRPLEDYFVLRDGENVTDRKQMVAYPLRGTDICFFFDGDWRPGRNANYRVGYGRGIGRKVSPPIPTGDVRCQEAVARARAGIPLRAQALNASSIDEFAKAARTVPAGTVVSFYFPFVRKEAVGAKINVQAAEDLLQSQRITVDFGDGTLAEQPANAIQHTFHTPGRYTVTARDPSGISDQQFTAVVEVMSDAAPSADEDLCRGEGPNCHALPLADIPAAALPYVLANVSGAPTISSRRGEEAAFVLSFENVRAPWQFGLGSTLVTFFGDGTKSIEHYDTTNEPGYPIVQHRWQQAGAHRMHSCLVRRTESGPRYACAFVTVKVD